MKKPNKDNCGTNKTKEYYYKLCRICYALGAPNYWYGDLGIPKYVATIHDVLVWIIDLAIYAFCVSIIGANFTQHSLSKKQQSDRQMFTCQPMWFSYILVFSYYRKEIQTLGYELAVKLKKEYNDPQVEEEMVRCFKFYSGIFLSFAFSALALFGLQSLIEVIFNGEYFVVVIPVWPDIHDPSTIGRVIRISLYVMWWICCTRLFATTYLGVIVITSSLSHQYKNLCSYFRNLNTIFEDTDITQEEMEYTYEKAFILGIQLHSSTLRCKERADKICYIIFSFQIIINLSTISILLLQLATSERTLTNLMTYAVGIVCTLIGTGCFMMSAGDITVEASQLSTAMFVSGWQHCRGRAALRARTLLVVAMRHSQRPVQLRCLGLIKISYSSYVKIVRLSYQVFSVLYSK